jgi:hypothetical protein
LGHSRRFKREVAREQPMKFLLWQVIDVCAVQPILAETETIVAQRDGCSCS